jgi:hypothetical protein
MQTRTILSSKRTALKKPFNPSPASEMKSIPSTAWSESSASINRTKISSAAWDEISFVRNFHPSRKHLETLHVPTPKDFTPFQKEWRAS